MLLDNAHIIKENRKTLKIVIDNNGQLNVYCPKILSNQRLEELLIDKEKFLTKKINKALKEKECNADILNYKKILLLGEEYNIVFTPKIKQAYFSDKNFLIPTKYNSERSQNAKINFVKKTIKQISNRILRKRFNEIIFSQKKSYLSNNLIIGGFKAKWGSCDSKDIIKLNWKCIMLKPHLIDFIIYHEITHLKEMNHSKFFYSELAKICPKHREYRNELKKSSFLLTLF